MQALLPMSVLVQSVWRLVGVLVQSVWLPMSVLVQSVWRLVDVLVQLVWLLVGVLVQPVWLRVRALVKTVFLLMGLRVEQRTAAGAGKPEYKLVQANEVIGWRQGFHYLEQEAMPSL